MAPLRNPLLRTPVRPLPTRIAVIGAGTIGPDIAYYLKRARRRARGSARSSTGADRTTRGRVEEGE